MAHRNYRIALGLALSALLAGACTATVDEVDPEPEEEVVTSTTQTGTSTGTGTETSTGTGCGAGPEETVLPSETFMSDCGGFLEATDGAGDPPAYCDAEVLHWTYDSTTGSLELLDTRIELNCCGDHDMSISLVGDVYVVTETDAPESAGGRCFCTCVFDFGLAAQNVPEQTINLRLIRHVTDEGDSSVVFDGTIDLTQGSGWEIIDDTPAMFCGEEPLS